MKTYRDRMQVAQTRVFWGIERDMRSVVDGILEAAGYTYDRLQVVDDDETLNVWYRGTNHDDRVRVACFWEDGRFAVFYYVGDSGYWDYIDASGAVRWEALVKSLPPWLSQLGVECPRCEGWGSVEVEGREATCPRCGGTERVRPERKGTAA